VYQDPVSKEQNKNHVGFIFIICKTWTLIRLRKEEKFGSEKSKKKLKQSENLDS
jgi:hypothetical protein